MDELVRKGFGKRKRNTTRRRSIVPSFADWAVQNAVSCPLSLGLDADVVGWIVSVMQSNGEMHGIENVTALERASKLRRQLRFQTERDWDNAQLAARVLFRTWEKETGRGS
jgi:hypothetical protein